MNQLSIIEEIVVVDNLKEGDVSNDQTEDSGLASSANSSTQSGNIDHIGTERCLIIKFEALNAKNGVRESTLITNGDEMKGNCDISGIGAENNAQTVNSEDGKIHFIYMK